MLLPSDLELIGNLFVQDFVIKRLFVSLVCMHTLTFAPAVLILFHRPSSQ